MRASTSERDVLSCRICGQQYMQVHGGGVIAVSVRESRVCWQYRWTVQGGGMSVRGQDSGQCMRYTGAGARH